MKNKIDQFLIFLKTDEDVSSHTLKSYSASLRLFLEFSAGNLEKIKEYREKLLTEPTNKKTKNLRLIPIRKFFLWLQKQNKKEKIPEIPELLKNKNSNHQFELPTEEIMTLFLSKTENEMEDLLVNFLASSGLRISEALKIKRGEVQEQFTIIGKGNKTRLVFCTQKIVSWIREYEERKNTELLFPFSSVWIQALLRRRSSQLLPTNTPSIHPHMLRHYFATKFLKKGGRIDTLQKILGHSNINTTSIYLNYSNADLLAEFRKCV